MTEFGRAALALLALVWAVPATSRDLGQWDEVDPAIAAWFRSLKMPDVPTVSCCGEADAYYADSYDVSKEGQYVAIITDERADEPLGRIHVPVGTRIVVPNHKIHPDAQNPTGHGIVFLSGTQQVYCYLAPGGV